MKKCKSSSSSTITTTTNGRQDINDQNKRIEKKWLPSKKECKIFIKPRLNKERERERIFYFKLPNIENNTGPRG